MSKHVGHCEDNLEDSIHFSVSSTLARLVQPVLTALFSSVWLNVDEAQPTMTELAENAPTGKIKQAT